MQLQILFEDDSVVVALKPPKVPSQPDKTGDLDMVSFLSEGREIFLVHRLDRPVGGIMVFAKNKNAAGILNQQIQDNKMKKTYYAVVCKKPVPDTDMLEDYMLKNNVKNTSLVVNKNTARAKKAILKYTLLDTVLTEEYGELSLLKVSLITGRHHQIRVQLAHRGWAIWGDNKYNEKFIKTNQWTQIALWAGELSFYIKNTKKEFYMPPEAYPFSLFQNKFGTV